LNVQPVAPFSLNEDWNLVTRTIIPTISTPLPWGERVTGIGDLNPTFFFSPVKPTNGIIWGAGPVFVLPTATNELTGQGKWSVGPSFVAVKIAGPWVIGALINNVWSVAGNSARESVNQMTLQPFLNYNFPGGWYLTSSPIITGQLERERRQSLGRSSRRRPRTCLQGRRPADQCQPRRLLQCASAGQFRRLAVALSGPAFVPEIARSRLIASGRPPGAIRPASGETAIG
jgi:hypothetical protein